MQDAEAVKGQEGGPARDEGERGRGGGRMLMVGSLNHQSLLCVPVWSLLWYELCLHSSPFPCLLPGFFNPSTLNLG